MKQSILFVLFCLISFTGYSQLAMGKWKVHFAYSNCNQLALSANKVFAVSEGALFSVTKDDYQIKTYSRVNGLSDAVICKIGYDSINNQLFICYQNGNIDVITENGIKNIPDLYNKQMNGDKTVNHITFTDNRAYLSCKFGIIALNTKKYEVADTYYIGYNGTELDILSTTIVNDEIFAQTKNNIYKAKANNSNLVDFAQWSTLNNLPGTESLTQIGTFNNYLLLQRNNILYKYDGNNWSEIFSNIAFSNFSVSGGKLILFSTANTIYSSDSNFQTTPITNPGDVAMVAYDNKAGNYWFASSGKGLQKLVSEQEIVSYQPSGPALNKPWNMTFANDKLYVVPGGRWSSHFDNPGKIMMYENNEWINIDNKPIEQATNLICRDLITVAVDPADSKHFYATSSRTGVYEFYNNEFVRLYNSKTTNNVIENLFGSDEYNVTDAAVFDNQGNLWISNSFVYKGIKILKKDGSWIAINHSELTGRSNLEQILLSTVQPNYVWINNSRYSAGIFVMDHKGTIDDTSDDQKIFLSSFTDGDGNKISPSNIYSMAEDKNGVVWCGTEQGPLLFYNSSKIFDSNYTCTRVKIPRNDGTNLADYLLQSDKIKAIAIDGANRKWIGTENSGVFLMSENGQETLQHFTTENSPLLSNDILSIAIRPKNGEVFIGTSNGLVSYQSDAAEAGETFGEVRAFPNPVRESYTGEITIAGLVANTQVKITDVNGNLIYQTTSNGSLATWNGKHAGGKKVNTGIYLVLCVNEDGTQSIATKIMIIN